MVAASESEGARRSFDRLRRAVRRRGFADTLLAMAEVAPTFPPALIAHGLELTHTLRAAIGERPVEASLWEELLALRRGPGADAFLAAPLPQRRAPEDLLLEKAVEVRALVDAVRNNRHEHAGQPLDRVLRKGVLRTRRVVVSEELVPVALRIGDHFAVVAVGDEHPRALRDRIEAALSDDLRELSPVRNRRITAPLLVGITPVPFAEALHLHRIGLEGPWLSSSEATGPVPVSVLSAHHLVLEGPGFAALRADFRRRTRAMRVALGMDAEDDNWSEFEGFSDRDSGPFTPFHESGESELHPALRSLAAEPEGGVLEELYSREAQRGTEAGPHRHDFAYNPLGPVPAEATAGPIAGLPANLQQAGRRTINTWFVRPSVRAFAAAPSVRYATIHRGAFSLPDFCYAYCRAQHDAMAVHHKHYSGDGFTFIVPHLQRDEAGDKRAGRRAHPVLCSFRTRHGAPESAETFKQRLVQRLEDADAGVDLLSRVLDDALRVALPDVLKSAVVRALELAPGDGGSFLGGRGLVSYMALPEALVDPVARYAGVYEGAFGGSCQPRGGISLMATDRGYRRDLCAVGTGIFRAQEPMDLFWKRFAWFLSQAAM